MMTVCFHISQKKGGRTKSELVVDLDGGEERHHNTGLPIRSLDEKFEELFKCSVII